MSPPNLPTVAPTFFHLPNLSADIVASEESPRFIFFDPALKLPPYRLEQQDFVPRPLTPHLVASPVLPREQEISSDEAAAPCAVSSSPKLKQRRATATSVKMPKTPIEPVDRNFASLKNIKTGTTISGESFNTLSDLAREYVEHHKDACAITPRLFKTDKWKGITNDFIETIDLVPHLFSKTRDSFDPENDRSWPEDKTDITFLCFALLKFHSIKQSTPKKRKETESGSPVPKKKSSKAVDEVEDSDTNDADNGKESGSLRPEDETPGESDQADVPEDEISGEGAATLDFGSSTAFSDNYGFQKLTSGGLLASPEFSSDIRVPPDFANGDMSFSGMMEPPERDTLTGLSKAVQYVTLANEHSPVPSSTAPSTVYHGATASSATTPSAAMRLDSPEPYTRKKTVKAFVNGRSTGGPINNIVKPTFSSLFGTVCLNTADPEMRQQIVSATRCHFRISNPASPEVWNIDLRHGNHDSDWIAYLRKIRDMDVEELEVDFLTSYD